MAVDSPQLKLDPYQSQVPLVQIPREDLQPGGPLPVQAGYMGKTGSAAMLGDQILKGWMKGREVAEQKKAQQANYAIDLSTKNEQNAWQTYQDSLRGGQSKPGDANDPAYQAYMKAHQATSDAMEKVAIPEKPKKGQQGQQGQKKKDDKTDGQPKSFGDKLKDFMQANPHFIPQLAIASRTPNKPVMTAQTEETKNQLQLQQQELQSNQLKVENEKKQAAELEQRKKIDQLGGIDAVAKSGTAPQELVMAARQAVSERLDKEGPDGQLRDKFAQDVLTGNSKNWTPADRQMAANLGYAAQPKEVKMTGKNGHEMSVLVDPTTNQPIPGTKPLDLGTPQWAQEFYGERAAKKADMRKAVMDNPEEYGVTLTGDKKTDDARIQAASERIFANHEEGIRAGAGTTGKTGYEVQRDDTILSGAAKEILGRIGNKAGDKANFIWPGESKPVYLSKQDVGGILDQFITNPNETPDRYGFRDKPQIQQGKDAGAAERDRQWVYQLVRNRMITQKGKNAMSGAQADALLKQIAPALTQPITADEASGPKGFSGPPSMTSKVGDFLKFGLGFGPPPGSPGVEAGAKPGDAKSSPAGAKLYSIPGQGVFELTPDEAAKAQGAGYQVQEVSPEMLQQFSQ